MSNSQEKTQASSDKPFSEKFADERIEWTDKVKSMSIRFKKVEELVDVQVDLYTSRQIAIEYQYRLIGIHTKLKKNILEAWKKAYDDLENADIRYNDKERTRLAEAATSGTKINADIVSNHIEFFRETVKTIDSMIFGVKHRIEIENFRAGMK